MQQPRHIAKAVKAAYAPLITALELQADYIKILEDKLKEKKMKLFEVPRNTKIKLLEDTEGPIESRKPNKNEEYLFSHLDGMYSLCYDSNQKVVYIPGWVTVEVLNDN